MKKFLTILISLLMIVTFTGCSSSDDDEGSVSGGDSQQQEDESTIVFEEVTVVDNDDMTIKLTAMDDDYTLTAYLENKSAENTYNFSLSCLSVDGIEISDWFYETVSAGNKVNGKIEVDDDDLDVLSKFTDIGLTFYVYDDDTYDEVLTVTAHVYPYGEENASAYVRETLDTDVILIDNEYVQMVATGVDHDDFWDEYELEVYLVNKTDSEVMFSVSDAAINGYMLDPFWATSVGANCVKFGTIGWYDSALEEQGIEEVEDIQLSMRVYDCNDWLADEYFEDTVSLTIS